LLGLTDDFLIILHFEAGRSNLIECSVLYKQIALAWRPEPLCFINRFAEPAMTVIRGMEVHIFSTVDFRSFKDENLLSSIFSLPCLCRSFTNL